MEPGSDAWLALVDEPIVDHDRTIVDPHHHLWPPGGAMAYGVDELVADTTCGHRVAATVFVECGAAYRTDGPRHEHSLGETEFVASAARDLRARHPDAPPIAGIVARTDLTLGEQLTDILAAHDAAADGLLRGIRDSISHAIDPDALTIPGRAPAGRALDPSVHAGVRALGAQGLTYDTWLYHYQLGELTELARAAPETTIVMDHMATPLGAGRFEGRRDEVFATWRTDIAELARCENVVAKIGGMAMPDNGFGWHAADRPPTSDEFVAAQRPYYDHTIDVFGPERCMFESNFPVDRRSLSYRVLWNGLKKIAAGYGDAEQDAMFSGTARRVYRL